MYHRSTFQAFRTFTIQRASTASSALRAFLAEAFARDQVRFQVLKESEICMFADCLIVSALGVFAILAALYCASLSIIGAFVLPCYFTGNGQPLPLRSFLRMWGLAAGGLVVSVGIAWTLCQVIASWDPAAISQLGTCLGGLIGLFGAIYCYFWVNR